MLYALVVRLLKLPLAAKLVGAQALGVALCIGTALILGWRPDDRGELVLLALAATAGLPATVALAALALRPLRQLEITARRIGEGDYTARVPDSVLADRSMERLSKTMNRLVDQLTDDRRRMRELASEVIRRGDEDRSRSAATLHESAAQSIASVSWQLGAIARDVSEEDLQHRLLFVKKLTEDVLEDVRTLAETMHPRVLTDLGLSAALSQLARHFDGACGARVTAHVDRPIANALDPGIAAAFYRTAHEAVSNAVTHAHAKAVRIWLLELDSFIRLEVIDDGVGFDVKAAEQDHRRGGGIFAMRDRLALVNAELLVESTKGSGTRICASIPSHPAAVERSA